MKNARGLVAFLLSATCALLASCGPRDENLVAITHVNVIDVTGGPTRPDQTIVIRGQRIEALGSASSVAPPSSAQLLDASGKFVIPGLADMHLHLTAAGEPDGSRRFMIPLLLANGITTVRDMGGYLQSLVPLRKEIGDGKRLGPSMVYAGPYLDGSPPSFQPSLVVTNREQAEEDVRQLVAEGVDFIKVQSMLDREAYFAIANAARRQHVAFVGHVPDRITAAEAAEAGQHSIEHLTNILRGCSRDEAKLIREQLDLSAEKETLEQSHTRWVRWQQEILEAYSEPAAEALIKKFVQKDVWQTPTLVLLRSNAFPTFDNPPFVLDERAKYIPPNLLGLWSQGHAGQLRFISAEEPQLRKRLLQKSLSLVAQMQKAGVKILAGTDSPAPYVFPGFALHDELELLVDAGFTPLDALRAATIVPAEFLNRTKDSGAVAARKYADLVLLEANPLEDIRNTRKIAAVVVKGKVLDRKMLDGLLDSERSFAAH